MICPCCSGKSYAECCRPYHEGKTLPPTPLALMRSRYSAYALGNSRYIIETGKKAHPREIKRFIRETKFVRLEIEGSEENWVQFTAHLEQRGKAVLLKEKSYFEQVDGKWIYLSGDFSCR